MNKPIKAKGKIIKHEKNEVDTLLTLAIVEKVPVETLEKLIALQKDVKAELARDEFNKAMSKFQGECPVIEKAKQAMDGSKLLYKYAGLDTIVGQVRKYLTNNGLSYTMDVKAKKESVKVTCTAKHVAGHTEQSSFEIPLANKTGIMSAPQQVAATATFAKRYAFCDVFGIMTGSEDKEEMLQDPKSFQKDTIKEAKARLKRTKNIKELLSAWSDLPASAKKEPKIVEFKDEIKDGFDNQNAKNEEVEGRRLTEAEKKEIIKKEMEDK